MNLVKLVKSAFPQTATGADLDRLAENVYGIQRVLRRPDWWPVRWWPRMWPFAESDRAMRRRIKAAVWGVHKYEAGEPIRSGQMVGMRHDGRVEAIARRPGQ